MGEVTPKGSASSMPSQAGKRPAPKKTVPWVKHTQGTEQGVLPMHSVHVDRHSARFVTTAASPLVKIWDLGRLITPEAGGTGGGEDAVLAYLSVAASSCDVARFAHQSDLLAVGDTEGSLHVYRLSDRPAPREFGSTAPPSRENWEPIFLGAVCSGSIIDLAWSQSDGLLATGGIDNYVRVFSSRENFRQVQQLKCDGPVKGVAWHPDGSVLSAQVSVAHNRERSARAVMLWDTCTWIPITVPSSELFRYRDAELLYLRHSWSADGHYCLLANALGRKTTSPNQSEECSVAAMRKWDAEDQQLNANSNVLGHQKSITVTRFRPASARLSEQVPQATYFAVASQDLRLSVWKHGESEPCIISSKQMFRQQILDIAWTPDGSHLLAVSECGQLGHWVF